MTAKLLGFDTLKVLCTAWAVNLIVFVVTAYFWQYGEAFKLWYEGFFYIMFHTSLWTKIFLSLLILISYRE